MRRFPMWCALCVAWIAGLSVAARGEETGSSRAGRAADLDLLVESIRETHPEWWWHTPEDEWESHIASARVGLDGLSEAGYYLRLARLVSLLRDGHSRVVIPRDSELLSHTVPVAMEWFAAGVFVTATAPGHTDLLGLRVVRIGSVTIEDALEELSAYACGDNPQSDLWLTERYLRMPRILHELGWSDDPLRTDIVIEDTEGRRRTVTLDAIKTAPGQGVPRRAPRAWESIDPGAEDLPRFRTRRSEAYWMEFLEDSGTVYVKYNSVADMETDPFPDFCERVLETAQRDDAQRLVVDLRGNGGGQNELSFFLNDAVIKSPQNAPGRLFVVIDGGVFSAAQNCATRLETLTYAIFVGEPTGGRPNHYGDATRIELPSTGYALRCSTMRWQDSQMRDRRIWIKPDIVVNETLEDRRAGRDAPMEAILGVDPADWAAWGEVWPTRHWWRDSQWVEWP